MTPRPISTKIHDRAKVATVRTLIDRHRAHFDMLRWGWMDYLRQSDPNLSSRAVCDRARCQAISDLIEMNRPEYDGLRAENVQRFKAELGWSDERPAANRARSHADQPRSEHGYWMPASSTVPPT